MDKRNLNRRDFLKLLGLTPFIFTSWPASSTSNADNRSQADQDLPNILVLVFDAFSARNSSLYGYARETNPNIERFAQRATVFHRHYAGGNFTSPGTASLLTGTYPWTHRVFQFLGSVDKIAHVPDLFSPFAQQYHTFAYTHNPLAFILLNQFRASISELTPVSELCLENTSWVDQLFSTDYSIALEAENLLLRNITYPSGSLLLSPLDTLRRFFLHTSLNRSHREDFPRGISRFVLESPPGFMYFALEDAIDWLQVQLQEMPRPFLGYIHMFPPHSPYITRKEFYDRFDDGWQPPTKPDHFFSQGYSPEQLAEERRLYDEAIAYVDAEFGRLYDAIQDAGVLDDTYLMLTSDHGEMFERGIVQHNTPTLYEPIVNIPLVISSPGQSTRQDVYAPTSNIDILPTLCRIAGQPIPANCEGQALPISGLAGVDADRSVYVVEAKENSRNAPLRTATIALVKGSYKLIYTYGYTGYPDTFELYDLSTDPEELTNIYQDSDPLSQSLKEELLAKLAEVGQK